METVMQCMLYLLLNLNGNFEIYITLNSERDCRIATAIVSSSASLNPVVT
jgi:hypothetical protein